MHIPFKVSEAQLCTPGSAMILSTGIPQGSFKSTDFWVPFSFLNSSLVGLGCNLGTKLFMWFQYSAKLELVLDVAHWYKAYLISCMFASHHFYTCSMSATWIYFYINSLSRVVSCPKYEFHHLDRIWTAVVIVENGALIGLHGAGESVFLKKGLMWFYCAVKVEQHWVGSYGSSRWLLWRNWVEERQMFWLSKKKRKTQTFIINIVNKSRFLKSCM